MDHYKKLLELQSALTLRVKSNHANIVHFVGLQDNQFSSLVGVNLQLEDSFKGLVSNYCLSVEHPNAGHKPSSDELNTLSYAYHVAKDGLLLDKEHLRRLNAPPSALDKVDVEIDALKQWLVAFQRLWH